MADLHDQRQKAVKYHKRFTKLLHKAELTQVAKLPLDNKLRQLTSIMKTVPDKYNDRSNADFMPLVAAIGEIIDKIHTLAAPREEVSPASSSGQSPARAVFQGPNSAPTSV